MGTEKPHCSGEDTSWMPAIEPLVGNQYSICLQQGLSYRYCDDTWLSPLEKATMVHSSHSYSESHRENFDYGTNTAIFITGLIVVYLVAVVFSSPTDISGYTR